MDYGMQDGKRYPKGEKSICEYYGLKPTPASGAHWKNKGDATAEGVRIEIKETDKESLSVKKEWLTKITKEAAMTGVSPRLLFRIGSEIWVATPAGEYFDN